VSTARKAWFNHWIVLWSWVCVCGLGIALVLRLWAGMPRMVGGGLLALLMILVAMPAIVMNRVNRRTVAHLASLRAEMAAEDRVRDLPPNGR
jgi:hypothetical protein